MDSVIVFCAKYVIIFVGLGWLIAWLKAHRDLKMQLLVATIIAGIVALVLSRIVSRLYYDPRPFVTEHVKPLISHGPDNGFPSDHALLTMTLTGVVYFYRRKVAAAMLLLTIIVGIARILAKVHSPLDIAGGWVLGLIGAAVGFYAARWLLKKHSSRIRDLAE